MGLQWIGVVVLVAGLALRLRTSVVVVLAAFSTGWAAGLPLLSQDGQEGLLAMLGRAFADNRMLTLFLLTLPTVGMAERYGLQQRAAAWIKGMAGATPGRLLWSYQFFRVLCGALGLRLNGHPTFVRPLVAPMACVGQPEGVQDLIRAGAAAAENYGNFYGQNLCVIQGGILLAYSVLHSQGYDVSLWRMVFVALAPVVFSLVLGAIQFTWLDRKIR